MAVNVASPRTTLSGATICLYVCPTTPNEEILTFVRRLPRRGRARETSTGRRGGEGRKLFQPLDLKRRDSGQVPMCTDVPRICTCVREKERYSSKTNQYNMLNPDKTLSLPPKPHVALSEAESAIGSDLNWSGTFYSLKVGPMDELESYHGYVTITEYPPFRIVPCV